jgi:hypothetical protein
MAYITEAEIGGDIGFGEGDFLIPRKPLIFESDKLINEYKTTSRDVEPEIFERNKKLISNMTPISKITPSRKEYLEDNSDTKNGEKKLSLTTCLLVVFIFILIIVWLQSQEISMLREFIIILLASHKQI